MGYIYKVTNNINGNIYIGQTSRTIQQRWNDHIYQTYSPIEPYKSALHDAIKKYGQDSFTVTEVEQCANDKLNEREIYWIDYYNSYNKGYNLSRGGGGWRKCDDEKLMELWNAGYSVAEMIEMIDIGRDTISNHLKSLGVSGEEIEKRGKQCGGRKKSKPVYQYDIDGNFIREFQTIKDAEKYIGGIQIHTDTKYKSYGGYLWRNFKVDKIDLGGKRQNPKPKVIKESKPKPVKKVYQYSIYGEYIQSFNSCTEAAEYLQKNSPNEIGKACNGYRKQTYGYQWRYEKFDKIESIAEDKSLRFVHSKEVHQYDIDGNYIQSFDNSEEAAKALNMKTSRSIRKVCDGKLRQTHGFQWRHEKYDKIESIRDDNRVKFTTTKEVHQYNMNGEYIQSFASSSIATQFLNEENPTKIKRACLGDVRQAYGFLWSYKKVNNYNDLLKEEQL